MTMTFLLVIAAAVLVLFAMMLIFLWSQHR